MKSSNEYVSNRVLRVNVGFLLSDGPGVSRDMAFDVPVMRVDDDLQVLYLRGPVRFSRTSEGILVQGELHVGMMGECSRCLDPAQTDIPLELEELFSYPAPHGTEFSVGDDAILDLTPLVRGEVLIAADRRMLCRPDCKGLCPECGANWNHESCDCAERQVDPRLSSLNDLLKE